VVFVDKALVSGQENKFGSGYLSAEFLRQFRAGDEDGG